MDLLAHAVFADGPDDVLFGAIFADLIRGPVKESLPSQVLEGIHLHNNLDEFFDDTVSTGVVKHGYNELVHIIGHYAHPVLDSISDHIIASHWEDIFDEELSTFTGQVYEVLLSRKDMLPVNLAQTVDIMVQRDWLSTPVETQGLKKSLFFLAERAKNPRASVIKDRMEDILQVIPYLEEPLLHGLSAIREYTDNDLRSLGYASSQRVRWRDEINVGEGNLRRGERL